MPIALMKSLTESSEEEFDSQEALHDWMQLKQRRMLVVTLTESFKTRQRRKAATEAGSFVGLNEKTVRKYGNDIFANKRKPYSFKTRKPRSTLYLP